MVGLRFTLLALFLASCSISENKVSIYPIREPFEYQLTATYTTDESYIIDKMTEACNDKPFVIMETQNGSGFRLVTFRCKVGN